MTFTLNLSVLEEASFANILNIKYLINKTYQTKNKY